MNKFCTICGKKLHSEETGYFDRETGKKSVVMVCKNLSCLRGCEKEGHLYKFQGLSILTLGFTPDEVCLRCGEKNYWGGY